MNPSCSTVLARCARWALAGAHFRGSLCTCRVWVEDVTLLDVDLDRADRAPVPEPCPQPPCNVTVTVLRCPRVAAPATACRCQGWQG